MQTDIDPRDLIGHKAVDRNGDKIGTVDEVYLDDATGEPEWAAVRTGIFGRDAFVPLTTSEFSGEELRVPYDKSLIKESPDFGVGQHLSPAQELQLYRYYGLDTSGSGRPQAPQPPQGPPPAGRGQGQDMDFGAVSGPAPAAGRPAANGTNGAPAPNGGPDAGGHGRGEQGRGAEHERGGRQDPPAGGPQAAATVAVMPTAGTRTAGPHATAQQPAEDRAGNVRTLHADRRPAAAPAPGHAAPSGPVEVICREERLDISTEWHVLGTARLRKYVTSEAVERRVPVVRERVRVERVPVTDAERASLTEQEIAEAMEEVTLREERPVVRKYLAPVERVRLVVERYTEEEVVREELRREQVEVHDGVARQPYGPQAAERTDAAPGAAAEQAGRPGPRAEAAEPPVAH
ncbi:DUF2382 domain-containing protein, partial [Kitasatospora sp. NPDC059571]|uniref:DUF2382 domain-containing protein n=1 Tax=Kitasatospora sp. NPDC059571 TaxID=3346871 RepID=UPI0036C2EB3E